MSPVEVVRSVRLHQARHALLDAEFCKNNNLNGVIDIANHFGFSSRSHFSRYYKQCFSESPRQSFSTRRWRWSLFYIFYCCFVRQRFFSFSALLVASFSVLLFFSIHSLSLLSCQAFFNHSSYICVTACLIVLICHDQSLLALFFFLFNFSSFCL